MGRDRGGGALADIEFRRVTKAYAAGVPAVDAISLAIAPQERLVVLGASGSGKTTLLRLIAGLESPDSGEVRIDGRDVTRLPAHRRDVAMVFQHPALYPHLSVFDNLAFGLRARGVDRNQVRARVNTVAGLLGLDALLLRRPSQLSGGEKQRVAIGRAIARQPRVLLFDEPFSNLDAPLRASLREEVAELHRQLRTTLVLVTHDQAEAMLLGDRIAVLERGRLLQHAEPMKIYASPASRSVATFIGSPPINILPCELKRQGERVQVHLVAAEPAMSWLLHARWAPAEWPEDGLVELGIRPESIRLLQGDAPPGPGWWSEPLNAQVRRVDVSGPDAFATVSLGPHRLVVRPGDAGVILVPSNVRITFDLRMMLWFEPASGRVLGHGG